MSHYLWKHNAYVCSSKNHSKQEAQCCKRCSTIIVTAIQDSRRHDNSYGWNLIGEPVEVLQAANSPELKSTQDKSTLNPTGPDGTKPCNDNQRLEPHQLVDKNQPCWLASSLAFDQPIRSSAVNWVVPSIVLFWASAGKQAERFLAAAAGLCNFAYS